MRKKKAIHGMMAGISTAKKEHTIDDEIEFRPPPGLTTPRDEQKEQQSIPNKNRKSFRSNSQNMGDDTDGNRTLPVITHPYMVNGLAAIEASRGRWDTLIEVLKKKRPTDGTLQVLI